MAEILIFYVGQKISGRIDASIGLKLLIVSIFAYHVGIAHSLAGRAPTPILAASLGYYFGINPTILP